MMEVAATGTGALAGLLLRHHGHHILLDCRAVPVLAPQPPPAQQQAATAATAVQQQQPPQLQLQLLLPAALHRWLLQAGPPEHKLHAVLLTSPQALLGLAALQECLQARGAELPLHTYCSEPCLHAYFQLVRELQDAQACLQHNQQHQQQPGAAVPTPTGWQHKQQQLVRAPLPSAQQLQAVLNAVQVVRFGEQLQLPGCFGLTAEARPAGGDIGTCLWQLTLGSHAYTYLCPASLQPGPARALHTPCLRGRQALLLGPGCLGAEQGQATPDSWPAAAQAALAAARAGGRVLVPVSTGDDAVLVLLDVLEQQLSGAAAKGAAGSCPAVLYLSPAAADKLATANSCCEYLEPTRQQAVLAAGRAPFACQQMLSAGRLRLVHGASGPLLAGAAGSEGSSGSGSTASAWSAAVQQVLQQVAPCIVFVPLWSMAGGPGALLTRAWCTNAANLLLLPPSGQAHTTAWLQQCCEQSLLPDRQTWRWQVQPVAVAASLTGSGTTGGSSSSVSSSLEHLNEGGLPATQLLQLVCAGVADGSSRCQIVAGSHDSRLLAAAATGTAGHPGGLQQQQQGGMAPFDVVALHDQASAASGSLAFAHVELPPPLVEAALSTELASQLQLQPLQVTRQPDGDRQQRQHHQQLHQQPGGGAAGAASGSEVVSVAHVQALLARRGQQWLLEPLPGVGAAAAPPLLVGTVSARALLQDLQAAGFEACWTPAAADQAPAQAGQGAQDLGVLVNNGAAEIRLSGAETEIVCDDASLHARLLECVMRQLQQLP